MFCLFCCGYFGYFKQTNVTPVDNKLAPERAQSLFCFVFCLCFNHGMYSKRPDFMFFFLIGGIIKGGGY